MVLTSLSSLPVVRWSRSGISISDTCRVLSLRLVAISDRLITLFIHLGSIWRLDIGNDLAVIRKGVLGSDHLIKENQENIEIIMTIPAAHGLGKTQGLQNKLLKTGLIFCQSYCI